MKMRQSTKEFPLFICNKKQRNIMMHSLIQYLHIFRHPNKLVDFQPPSQSFPFEFLLQFLKMQGRTKRQWLTAMFRTFFMNVNSLQTSQQLLLQIMECLAYITIINGVYIQQIAETFKHGPLLLLTLIALLLVRHFLGISLGIGVCLVGSQLLIKFTGNFIHANFVIIAILAITETITSISFDVSLPSAKSESRNSNKIFHNTLLLANAIIITANSTSVYLHLCSFILFFVLFTLKQNSLIKSEAYRSIMLRFYIWASMEHLRLFLNNFILSNSLLVFLGFAIGSQILFTVYSSLNSNSNLYELQAKEEYLKLGFYVLRNSYNDTFNESVQSFVKLLANQEELDELHPLQNTSNIVLVQLNKTKGFLQGLLKIEIHIINGQLLTAKTMLTLLKEGISWYNFVELILLYRMQQQILRRYEDFKGQVTIVFEREYLQYLAFEQLLHKASMQHLKFNLYLKKSEIDLACIKEICTKIIQYDQQIHKDYSMNKDCFSNSTYLFVGYLLKITNDLPTANQVINQHRIKEKYMIDYNLEEKIYIRLKLQDSGLVIDKIGYNSKQLLDYNRKDLEGQKIERIVPSFFRKQHESLSYAFVHQQIEKMFLFTKNTVVLNNKNYYSQCSIMAKLNFRLNEEFYFEGHLHITQNRQYDFSSFFFVNDRGNILEFSQEIGDFSQREANNLTIDVLFEEGTVGLPLTCLSKKGLQVFQPLLYSSNKEFYFYVKKMKQWKTLPHIQIIGEPKQQNIKQQAKCLQSKSSTPPGAENTQSKELIVMVALVFIFIGVLFGSQYLMIYSAQVKYYNQKFAVGNCRYLMTYYNASLKLQFNNLYIELRDYYNYTNTFFLTQSVSSSLKMQSVNEFLKPYYLSTYKLPTFSSQISYKQNNFQLIQNLIVNTYMYQVFRNDSFMKKIIIDNNKLLIPVIMQSTTDYRINLFNIMNAFVANDTYYEQLSFAVGMASILVFVVFAVRLFYRLRSVEESVLKYRCMGGYNHSKTNEILQFLHNISHEEIQTDKISQEIHIYETINKTESDSMFIKSEMSLIKEPTGRSLMNDSLNKTGFAQEMNREENKVKSQGSSNYYFRKGKSHRYILIIFGSFILLLLSLHVSNEILNCRMNDVNEVMSINSVINLYRTSGFYGSRATIATLNTILLKISAGVDYSKTYNTVIQGFYSYMKTVTLPIFPEASIPQFSSFSININNLYQSTICSFMPCIPLYHDQIDLNFISVINKISANLTKLVNQTIKLTPAQFTAYLAVPSNRLYIDLIFYTESTMRNYITDMIMLYLDNYSQFIEDLYSSKLTYIGAMIGISIIGLLLFIFMVIHIRKDKKLFHGILKIYK